ncbi:ATP-dependent RNA helicase DDX54 [Myotis davidii]|uniref:ATP-dependent RNA helicase DDX54 n=1 Tax=Myotis davidii TaxID=225400 RepID=L5LKT8_MYODS|nr:ATP-dependent RNA helicase DDX54 [Myotis davidii]
MRLGGLRLLQWVSYAHIYSTLDQTAHKINLAKFTLSKCPTLIMTDLAARAWTFRYWTMSSTSASRPRGSSSCTRCGRLGGVLGQVTQSVVDDEDCGLRNTLEVSLELRGLGCVSHNTQQQYVRSWPAPSLESIKRAKELDLKGLGLHPLFSSSFEEEELQQLRLVDSIKQYRSRLTILETNASCQDLSSQVMWPSSRGLQGHCQLPVRQAGGAGGPGWPSPEVPRFTGSSYQEGLYQKWKQKQKITVRSTSAVGPVGSTVSA